MTYENLASVIALCVSVPDLDMQKLLGSRLLVVHILPSSHSDFFPVNASIMFSS